MMIDLRVGANASIKSKYIMIEDHGIIYAIDLVIIISYQIKRISLT